MRIDPFVIKTWNQAGILHGADFTLPAAQALYEIMQKIYGDRAAEEFRIAAREEAERGVEVKLRGKRPIYGAVGIRRSPITAPEARTTRSGPRQR